jgi:hypothetical protein
MQHIAILHYVHAYFNITHSLNFDSETLDLSSKLLVVIKLLKVRFRLLLVLGCALLVVAELRW